MKKIIFSLHALNKIQILNKHQIFLDKSFIENIISMPDRIEKGYKSRLIAQGGLDDEHVLHVIYEESENELKVITIYPGRRSRYEKD